MGRRGKDSNADMKLLMSDTESGGLRTAAASSWAWLPWSGPMFMLRKEDGSITSPPSNRGGISDVSVASVDSSSDAGSFRKLRLESKSSWSSRELPNQLREAVGRMLRLLSVEMLFAALHLYHGAVEQHEKVIHSHFGR